MKEFTKDSKDLSRLCVHTITTKPWDIHSAIGKYSEAGIGGITVWRQYLDGENHNAIGKEITDAGLTTVALVRGGFFTGKDKVERDKAMADNKKAVDEAAAIGAPMVVLVCGATPGLSIDENLNQIQEGIEKTLPHAEKCGVKLAIEPLHPMYADIRSAVTTMKMANDLCDNIQSPYLGVAADVFHIWWDPDVDKELKRCGAAKNLLAFHICDWKIDMQDMLNDRGLMGEGVIDISHLRNQVDNVGFTGFHEVEVFSNLWWSRDQDEYLKEIIRTYNECS